MGSFSPYANAMTNHCYGQGALHVFGRLITWILHSGSCTVLFAPRDQTLVARRVLLLRAPSASLSRPPSATYSSIWSCMAGPMQRHRENVLIGAVYDSSTSSRAYRATPPSTPTFSQGKITAPSIVSQPFRLALIDPGRAAYMLVCFSPPSPSFARPGLRLGLSGVRLLRSLCCVGVIIYRQRRAQRERTF
ncbi:hypothetical protein PHLGIDRAFT_217498 [Phlebiopsis gigantea 11061_1 CR5-6]|uniref:Uncharacterized protein n=1 Tax=Phlebiopsis gigantea (strain 11061_1 CR5-6) TaxID=745531 RepID=A0A0C3S2M2_PHLG1|nr:hypothetical protein PHLGIDRAFT_217498 [Phlebiopsis gigantea 11061_1 CR5-6]